MHLVDFSPEAFEEKELALLVHLATYNRPFTAREVYKDRPDFAIDFLNFLALFHRLAIYRYIKEVAVKPSGTLYCVVTPAGRAAAEEYSKKEK